MRYEDIVSWTTRIKRRDVAAFSPLAVFAGLLAPSVLKGQRLRETIARLIPARRFDELEIALTIVCVDLDTGRPVRFGSGGRTDISLVDALYASCALPIYYPPLGFRGRRLADGGLHSPLPLDAIDPNEADLVVAVDVGPSLDSVPAEGGSTPPPLLRAHGAMGRIALARLTECALARWEQRRGGGTRFVLVRPVREREATFALGHMARYVSEGYRATRRALT
jgi:NTE family protein